MMKKRFRPNLEVLEGRETPTTVVTTVTMMDGIPLTRVTIVPDSTSHTTSTTTTPTTSHTTSTTTTPTTSHTTSTTTSPTTSHTTSTTTSPTTSATQHALAGTGSGIYICTLQYMNVPSGYHFTGDGSVKGMGAVQMQIDVYGVGFHNPGTAHGTITLTNAKGSVTVQITGPSQPKLSPLPQYFQYKIVQATGAYRGMTDSGTLRLLRTPDAVPVRFGLRFFETGSFRVII